jgi:hypothetical protein
MISVFLIGDEINKVKLLVAAQDEDMARDYVIMEHEINRITSPVQCRPKKKVSDYLRDETPEFFQDMTIAELIEYEMENGLILPSFVAVTQY